MKVVFKNRSFRVNLVYNSVMSRLKAFRTIFSAAFFSVLLWGCASSAPEPRHAPQTHSLSADFTPAKHLVFIGLDGWGGDYVARAQMPTVKRMISGGASSLEMRCILPSVSWPNWSALFCGATPEQRTGGAQRYPPEHPIDDFPSIFSHVKNELHSEQGMPALFYEWGGIQKICTPETADIISITSDRESAEKAAAYIIEKKPAFIALVFNQPDSTGHTRLWGSPPYYAKLAELDSYIAIIEQAVQDAGMSRDTVFVLSGDHGGSFWGHGRNLPYRRKIPFIACGPGIKQNYVIPPPLSICDIAPTMAAILGLESLPEWTGRPLREIFE